MSAITARVVAHTRDPETGARIVTVEGDIPTSSLAQLNKHTVISGSAQSARAVPTRRMLRDVPKYEPAWFGTAGARVRGMADGDPVPPELARRLGAIWRDAERAACHAVEALQGEAQAAGWQLSKGTVNRLLAPFRFTRVVLTGLDDPTAWGWFDKLRARSAHGPAEAPLAAFARAVRAAIDASEPVDGQLHIPYDIGPGFTREHRILHSAGRCGGVSYRGEPTAVRARVIGERMRAEGHLVPFEHQCFTSALIGTRRRPLAGDLDGLRGRHWRPYARPSWLQVRKVLEPVELNGGARVVDPWRARARRALGIEGAPDEPL